MTTTQLAYLALVALIGVERLVELAIARRNARLAFARGGREVGRRHYAVMVVLHGLLLVAAPLEVVALDRPLVPPLALLCLAMLVASQGLRYWCVMSLGRQWNTRVIVVPGESLVERGPYRHLRHPNYLAVVIEVAALPLVHGAWLTAVLASVANAVLLAVRIGVEERALLAAVPEDDRYLGRPRLVPGLAARQGVDPPR